MADITFPEFDSKTHLLSSDYFVGYDSVALKEIKTPITFFNKFVTSDTTNIPSASAVSNIVMISFANFMALETRDPKTAYLIVDESQVIQ